MRSEDKQQQQHTKTDRHKQPYHALCERGHILRGVVRHTSDQAAEFGRSGNCKHHRLVSSDVADIAGYGLELLLRDWSHRAFEDRKDSHLTAG